ncbi:hypothetical protein [Candidatus Cyanaurora vandensis]|nr:hypothetical protein [Candidatus Cyanaurora vandensis]
MKTHGLFYTFFQKLPSAFFDTLGLPPQTADLYYPNDNATLFAPTFTI